MSQKGFSMVELLIAMAILAIGAALAAPMFTNLIESSRLTSTANSVVESLALARSEAVKRNAVMQVIPIDGDWRQGWQVTNEAGDVMLQQFEPVPAALTMSADPDDVAAIQFAANGMRTVGAAALTVRLCGNSGRGRDIAISMAGSTQVTQIESGCVAL